MTNAMFGAYTSIAAQHPARFRMIKPSAKGAYDALTRTLWRSTSQRHPIYVAQMNAKNTHSIPKSRQLSGNNL